MIKAAIIAIGNELLSGLCQETNSQFLIRQLKTVGIEVDHVTSIGDCTEAIIQQFNRIPPNVQIVLVTGGLGPTHDDVTKAAVSQYFQSPLEFNSEIYEHIRRLFEARRLEMNQINKEQAYLPQTAEILHNRIGTAAGMKFIKNDQTFYFMPGVPREMQLLFLEQILPELSQLSNQKIYTETLQTTGFPEAQIFAKIHQWIDDHPETSVSILPDFPNVNLSLTLVGKRGKRTALQNQIEELASILGDAVYGSDGDTLEAVVGKLLAERNLTFAVAESCTGGLISHRLTNIPGSSQYFMHGSICYSNQAKIQQLGVKSETLQKYGAVSIQTAIEMAEGVRRILGTKIGLSTTGIAGPAGGSAAKPVGTVYIGIASDKSKACYHFFSARDRILNKSYFSQMALNQLRLFLKLRQDYD
jgi:nicotinamide-nucleotide amidase